MHGVLLYLNESLPAISCVPLMDLILMIHFGVAIVSHCGTMNN